MRLLETRTLLSYLAASVTGLVLYLRFPFPEMNVFLNLIKVKDLPTFLFLEVLLCLFPVCHAVFCLLSADLVPLSLRVTDLRKKKIEALHAASIPGSSAARRALSGPG